MDNLYGLSRKRVLRGSGGGRGWFADMEFSVRWTERGGHFEVCRNGITMPAHAPDRKSAINLAIREAKQEAILTRRRTSVTSVLNERKVIEWDSRDLT